MLKKKAHGLKSILKQGTQKWEGLKETMPSLN